MKEVMGFFTARVAAVKRVEPPTAAPGKAGEVVVHGCERRCSHSEAIAILARRGRLVKGFRATLKLGDEESD
ncbi:putative serine/threonine-protein kinase [Sesbania bispinosa]|nr:putative serine/threonine-protein kinase [Sesbania bispinosa]